MPELAAVLERLEALIPGAVVRSEAVVGDDRVWIAPAQLVAVCAALKSDPALDYKLLADLTAVDYLGEAERFEVVYQLYSLTHNARLRLKVRVAEGAEVPSVAGVWRGADPYEREVWDMFGIRFAGHPNLTRLIMYESFEGHPLRKDYPLKQAQPIAPLRTPLVVTDDPPYQQTRFDRARRPELAGSRDALGRLPGEERQDHDR